MYVGLVAEGSDPSVGGLLHVPTANGLNIRIVELVAAGWTVIFSIPVLVAVPELPRTHRDKANLFQAYVLLVRHVARLWREDRNVVLFLISSAVFRDGLVGIFTYGSIIASGTFGFSAGEVLIFGIAANVVAGVSTALSGRLDDRLGPRTVMLISLIGLVVAGVLVFAFHGGGQTVFWIGVPAPVPLRRASAVGQSHVPDPGDTAGTAGRGLRSLRDDRARGHLPCPADVHGLHRPVRRPVLGNPGHRRRDRRRARRAVGRRAIAEGRAVRRRQRSSAHQMSRSVTRNPVT